uniref:Transthyretin-like family protein n=1 Tax=Haemonchus contortus TaxID=6289 RepID=A0A7I4YSM8_HAECO
RLKFLFAALEDEVSDFNCSIWMLSSITSTVKLWEEDSGPDPDDLLDEGKTSSAGTFTLKGSDNEITTIDPVFKIYHDCDDGIKPGQRKVKFRIPSSYISTGSTPKRTFDIGVLNLETIFPGEERDFI